MMRRFIAGLAAAYLLLVAPSAHASDCWGNVGGAQANCGVVNMYLNGSGQSVGVSPTAPLPMQIYSSGGTAIDYIDLTASGAITTQNLSPTGTATAASAVAISTVNKGTVQIQVSANTLNQPLTMQATVDGVTWVSLSALQSISSKTTNSFTSQTATIAAATTGIWELPVAGYAQFRVSENAAVTGSATVTLTAATTASTINIVGFAQINGQSGDASTAAGSPVGTGGLVATSQPTAATNGQRKTMRVTTLGDQINKPFSVPELDWYTGASPITITAANQAIVAAGAAGIRNYMTWVNISCGSTWTVNTLQFQTATTVIYELDLPAGAGVYHQQFVTPLKTAAAAALNVKATGAVTGSCKVNAGGYLAP